MNIVDLEIAVNIIQQDIYESTGGVEYFNLTVSTNGFVSIVDFCGIQLWTSEDDDRPYVNKARIPVEQHLRELLRHEIKKLSHIVV